MSVEFIKAGTQTSDTLAKLRSESDSEHWERLTNERAIRRMLIEINGMTNELIDAAILGIVQGRQINNYYVTFEPVLGNDGSIHCVICNQLPVECAVIISDHRGGGNTGLQEEDKDLCFVSYICNWHAINPTVAELEIQRQNVWLRLLELKRKYEREENET